MYTNYTGMYNYIKHFMSIKIFILIAVMCVLVIIFILVRNNPNLNSSELYQPALQAEGDKIALQEKDLLERLQKQINKLDGIKRSDIVMNDNESIVVKITLDGNTQSMLPDEDELKNYIEKFTQKQDISIVIENK